MFTIKEGTAADKIGEGTPPEVLTSITAYLEKTGHVVRTADQEKAYLQTQTQQEINKVLGERNAQFEATILETTGVAKTQGEKFHEYHKRAITEKLGEVATLQAKVKDFETKGLQGSELAQQYKRDLEAAQGQIKTLNDEWEKKLNEKDGEVFGTKVMTEQEKVVARIKASIDPTIKPEFVEDIVAARIDKFNKQYKAKNLEGMIALVDKDGKTVTNKKDGKPLSFEEVLTPFFDDITKKREQGGAGSGSGGDGGNSGKEQPKWKEIQLPATVTSQVKLTEFLMKEAKLDPNTKEYSDAFVNFKGNLPLR